MLPDELSRRFQEFRLYVGWSKEDAQRLQILAPLVAPHFPAIVEEFDYAIIMLDPDGRIVSWNAAAERIEGYTEAEIVGRPIDVFYTPEDVEGGIPHEDLQRAATEGHFRGEGWRIRKDGTRFWASITITALRTSEGGLRGFANVTRDITDQKRAAEELRKEHDFAQTLIETAQAIVLILDCDGRIVQFNRFTEDLCGYSLEEVVGHDWFETFLPESERAALRERFHQAINGVPTRGNINPIVARNGTRRQIAWWANTLQDADGQTMGILSIGHDVTELREAQQRALQAERLAAIGEAMAGLAHESRNALQRSQASLEMLRRRIEDRPEALELLNRIQNAQDDLHQLYEEVREYAAPIRFQPRISNVSEILQEAWQHLEVRRIGRTAELHEAGQAEELDCEVDRFAIRQVFRNILENSLAATDSPVEIRVHYSPTEVQGRAALGIAIRDNGPGLTPEARERIFDEFYTTKTHGTGLGMAICKRFVAEHGGQIAVGDESGPGAEIFIILPRKQS